MNVSTQNDVLDRLNVVATNDFLGRHVFIHTHIEKTAGSALVQGLAAIVGWAQTVDTRTRTGVDAASMRAEEKSLVRLYSGHFDYGPHVHFAQRPLYVAAVRNPIERAVSYYRYIRERTGHPKHEIARDNDFETAFDMIVARRLSVGADGQCQRVMGQELRAASTFEEVEAHVRRNYFAVIPQKRVNEFVGALRQAMNLPPIKLMQYNVGTGSDVEITPAIRKKVAAQTELDRQLYQFAREQFEETLIRAKDYVADALRG